MKKFYIILAILFTVNSVIAQWVIQNSGTTKQLKSVYFTDVNTGYAVGDDNTGGGGIILKTTNGGIDWITQMVEDSLAFNSVFFTDTNTGYVVGKSNSEVAGFPAIILKTTDGGTTWSMIFSYVGAIDNQTKLTSVFFPDVNTGYALGCSNYSSGGCGPFIVKTINGGANWTVDDPVPGDELRSIFFTSVDIGFAVGHGDGDWIILKTTNGGIDWTATNSGILWNGGDLRSVYFSDPNTGYAVGERDGALILKTTNGGAEWVELPSEIDQYLKSVYFINADTGYVINGYNGIYKTTNGGTDWFEQSSGTNHWLNSIYIINADTGYIVGWDGTILKTTNGGGPPMGINMHRTSSKSMKIYPNPTLGKIDIEISEISSRGQLSILDLNGQELLKQTITKPSSQIDISNLQVGMYFIKFINENIFQVVKIIKE